MSYNVDAQVFETQIVIENTTQPAGVTSGSIINKGSLSTLDTYVTGHTIINDVKITPNKNDIIFEQQATLTNNTNSFTDIIGFEFDDSLCNSFKATINVTVSGAESKLAVWEINGLYKPEGWVITSSFTGDLTGVQFSIRNKEGGIAQIQYTNSNTSGTTIIRYRAITTAPPGSTPLGVTSGVVANTSGPFIADNLVYASSSDTLATTDISYKSNVLKVGGLSRLVGENTNEFVSYSNGGAITSMGDASIAKKMIVGQKIGVANTSPAFQVDVTGDINFTGSLYKNGSLYSGSEIWNTNGTSVFYTTGNVGLGTSSPSHQLDVSGGIRSSTGVTTSTVTSTSVTSGNVSTTNMISTNSTVENLLSSNANLTTGTVGTLVSSSATITNANVTTSSIGTLVGSSATITNANVTTSSVGTLVGSSATITNSNVTTETVGTLLATNANVTTSSIGTLVGSSATITNSNVTTETVGTLLATNANVTTSSIGTLVGSTATITNANVTTSSIGTLVGSSATITNANVTTSSVGTLVGSSATITNSNVTTETVGTLLATNANVTTSSIGTLVGSSATITNSNVTTETVGTLLATNANVTTSSIGTLVGSSATITNANVTTSTIGTSIITGNVGIGTVSPSGRLHLYTATTAANIGTVIQNGDRQFTLGIRGDTSNSFAIQDDTASAFRMVINTAGNVGFGTNLPTYRVDIGGSVRATSGDITLGSLLTSTANVTTGTVGTLVSSTANITTGTVGTLVSSNVNATTVSGSTVVATTYTGGSMSLSGNLTLAGTLTTVNITTTNISETNVSAGTVSATNIGVTTQTVGTSRITSNLLAVGNSNTVGNIFTTGGNVGIGVTNPVTWSQLHLKTPSSVSGAFVYLDATTSTSGKSYAIGSSLSGNISGGGNLEFYDATSDAARMVIGSTGNVGIANNTPGYRLDVSGSFRATSGDVTLGSTLVTNSNVTTQTTGTSIITTSLLALGNSNTVGNIFTTGGNVGIGIASPQESLHVSSSNPVLKLQNNSGSTSDPNSGAILLQQTNNTGVRMKYDGATDYFTIQGLSSGSDISNTVISMKNDTTGFVGIGTASPNDRLHLYTATTSGNIGTVVQNGNQQYRIGIRGDTNNSFVIQDDTVTAFRMVINTAGNVGFGTSLPGSVVDAKGVSTWGTVRVAPSTSGGEVGVGFFALNDFTASSQSTSGNWLLGTGISSLGTSNFGLMRNTTAMFAVSTAGNMTVVGDITAFGNISDMRFKENVQDIQTEFALNKIKSLRPVTFTWKDNIANESKIGTEDAGFIAQEVEEVIEYAVDDFEEIGSGEIYKKIKHERIIPYLVGAIQRLEARIAELEKQ
jgi:hypothetical protein